MNKILKMLDGKPFIESWDDVKELPYGAHEAAINDFALANLGHMWGGVTSIGKPAGHHVIVPSPSSDGRLEYYYEGHYSYLFPSKTREGIAPALRVNLPPELSQQKNREKVFGCKTYVVRFAPYTCKNNSHDINIIAFDSIRGPRVKADKALTRTLQELLEQGMLEKTGYTYTGCGKDEYSYRKFETYVYEGREFVYMQALSWDEKYKYADKSRVKNGEMIFIEVLPIPFIIRGDWYKLPKCINPQGTGELNSFVLRQEELAIAGVPYTRWGNSAWGNWDFDYNDELCDARLYVENNYVQEFFRDDESENYTINSHKNSEEEM